MSVLTSENKTAMISVSDSIPIATSQQLPIGRGRTPSATATTSGIGTQSVEYRNAGVVLPVTPQIGERETVARSVKQDFNNVGNREPPTNPRRIVKREVDTLVARAKDETLALGVV